MVRIDLSSAFGMVNIPLFQKRLQIINPPQDVIELIKVWLMDCLFYMSINGNNNFILFDILCGTVQGSIFGPLRYAIYLSPVFHLVKMSSFKVDNFSQCWDQDISKLVRDMKKELEPW
jgi:hypothetical protein